MPDDVDRLASRINDPNLVEPEKQDEATRSISDSLQWCKVRDFEGQIARPKW